MAILLDTNRCTQPPGPIFLLYLFFFPLLRVYPYPGTALGVKAYIWRVFAFSHFSCKIHSLKGVLFPSFPLKVEIEIQICSQKLLPEGSDFEMEIQIQTRLINTIWGPKSENSARMLIAYCLFPLDCIEFPSRISASRAPLGLKPLAA